MLAMKALRTLNCCLHLLSTLSKDPVAAAQEWEALSVASHLYLLFLMLPLEGAPIPLDVDKLRHRACLLFFKISFYAPHSINQGLLFLKLFLDTHL